jgi:hypothetical protein
MSFRKTPTFPFREANFIGFTVQAAPSRPASGALLYLAAPHTLHLATPDGDAALPSGTVTSVALTVPTGLSVTGSPITGSGTFAITTALTGLIKGTGTGFVGATAGTDFLAPSAIGTTVQGYDATLGALSGKAFAGAGDIVLKSYVDALLVGAFVLQGGLNCSANPNYPSATKGWAWVVTTAGKVGGSAGTPVDVGDVIIAKADNGGGTQAAVGASWFIVEHNLQGAVLAANNLSDVNAPSARTNLGGTTVGQNFFTLANPSAVRFVRLNADNSISALDAAAFLAAIGAQPSSAELSKVHVHATSVAAAGWVDIESVTGEIVDILPADGVAEIGGFNLGEGHVRVVRFTSNIGLSNSTNLILPAGPFLSARAGDIAVFCGYGSNSTGSIVRCISYQRIDGTALVSSGGGDGTLYNAGDNLSGSIVLARSNGRRQRITLNGDATIGFYDGSDGDELVLVIEWNSGNSLNFDAVRMPAAAAARLPLGLTAWKTYRLEFMFMGGYWALIDFSAPFPESID